MNEPWLLLVVGGVVGLLLAALVGLIALFVQVRRLPTLQQQLDVRLQARIALEELTTRCPDFAVDAAKGEFAGGNYVRRYLSLPFHPTGSR